MKGLLSALHGIIFLQFHLYLWLINNAEFLKKSKHIVIFKCSEAYHIGLIFTFTAKFKSCLLLGLPVGRDVGKPQ